MVDKAYTHMDVLDFAEAVAAIKQIVLKGNGLLAANNFWTLAKGDDAQIRQLQDLIYLAFEVTRVSSILLLPICPDLARQQLACVDSPYVEGSDIKPLLRIDLHRKIKAQLHHFKRVEQVGSTSET